MASPSKKRKLNKADGSNRYFSDVIVAAILPRLPAQDLVRFRCVSKPWCALISRPDFVAEQRNHALGTKSVALLSHTSARFSSLESLEKDNNGDGGGYIANYSWLEEWAFKCIVGSCNGLICLLLTKKRRSNREPNRTGCLIWNPSTRVSNMLPHYYISQRSRVPDFYGLGYDPANDDYKVVLGYNGLEQTIAVFSLKAGSWRTHVGLQPSGGCLGRGCLLKGTLHWPYFDFDVDMDHSTASNIFSFSLGDEKVQEMMSLSNINKESCLSSVIETIEDCLVVFLRHIPGESEDAVTIWMMKEYGVDESWTELIQVPSEYVSRFIGTVYSIHPITILKNGEVLIQWGYDVAVYNPNKKTHRIVFKGFLPFGGALTYVETLVSPNVLKAARQKAGRRGLAPRCLGRN